MHPAVLTRFRKKIPEFCPHCDMDTMANVQKVHHYKNYYFLQCKNQECKYNFVKFIEVEKKSDLEYIE